MSANCSWQSQRTVNWGVTSSLIRMFVNSFQAASSTEGSRTAERRQSGTGGKTHHSAVKNVSLHIQYCVSNTKLGRPVLVLFFCSLPSPLFLPPPLPSLLPPSLLSLSLLLLPPSPRTSLEQREYEAILHVKESMQLVESAILEKEQV